MRRRESARQFVEEIITKAFYEDLGPAEAKMRQSCRKKIRNKKKKRKRSRDKKDVEIVVYHRWT